MLYFKAHRNIKGFEKVRLGDHVSAYGALESVWIDESVWLKEAMIPKALVLERNNLVLGMHILKSISFGMMSGPGNTIPQSYSLNEARWKAWGEQVQAKPPKAKMPVSTSCPVLMVILGRSGRWWKTNGRRMTSNVTQISLKVDVTVNIHMNFKCINYVKLNFMTPSPSTFKHLKCLITKWSLHHSAYY